MKKLLFFALMSLGLSFGAEAQFGTNVTKTISVRRMDTGNPSSHGYNPQTVNVNILSEGCMKRYPAPDPTDWISKTFFNYNQAFTYYSIVRCGNEPVWFTVGCFPGQPYKVSTAFQLPINGESITISTVNSINMSNPQAGYDYSVGIRHISGNSYQIVSYRILSSNYYVEKTISQQNVIGIAPNPTYNTTNLTLKVAEAGDLNLSVLDVTGRTMTTNNQYLMEGEQVIPIDLSNMPAGIYFVNWQLANGEKGTTKVSKK